MDDSKITHSETLGLSKADLEALFESTFRNNDQNSPQKGGYLEADLKAQLKDQKQLKETSKAISNPHEKAPHHRIKSSLRMKYEAEVNQITKIHGDLESMRRKLQLSKRKMAQLLLVDPSAWTRWTSEKGEAPPHIYRALQWYLLLQEKHPEYSSSLWLNAVSQPQISQKELDNIKKEVISSARQNLEDVEFELRGESFKERHSFEKKLTLRMKERDQQIKMLKWVAVSQFCLISLLIILSIIF